MKIEHTVKKGTKIGIDVTSLVLLDDDCSIKLKLHDRMIVTQMILTLNKILSVMNDLFHIKSIIMFMHGNKSYTWENVCLLSTFMLRIKVLGYNYLFRFVDTISSNLLYTQCNILSLYSLLVKINCGTRGIIYINTALYSILKNLIILNCKVELQ